MDQYSTDPAFRTTTEQDTPAKIVAIAIGVMSLGYFAPGSVATYRNTDNQALVWWLCALTSWTVVGWVVALILAAQRTEKHRLSVEKSWPARHPALLAGSVAMGLMLIIGGITSPATSDPTVTTAVPSGSGADLAPAPVVDPVDIEPVEIVEPEPAGPVVVLDASHSGAESTEDFAVSGRYELDYSYECDLEQNFVLQMNDSSGFPVEMPVNTIGASGSDTLTKRMTSFSGGPFYVEAMFDGCDWTIKVTDLPD